MYLNARKRTSSLVSLVAAVAAALSPIAHADQLRFEIAAGPAEKTLNEFISQTGLQLLFDFEAVSGLTTRSVSGQLEVKEALSQMLAGTGLVFEFVNDRTIAVVKPGAGASESSSIRDSRGEGASAEAGGVKLEEVVVTATKRQERVQDIPMSIAVIGNQDIERRGLTGMEDYLRSIPGVNQMDTGGRDNSIVIRGITTSPELQNLRSGTTVASYFDETPITGAAGTLAGGIDVRPVDIERIEVLRGPQGTTFGSSSLGGAMRIIPVKPQLDGFGAKVSASYSDTSGAGSDNSMLQGVINVPVVAEKFALRAVGYRYDDSGFYRNVAGINPATIAVAANYGLGDYVRGHAQDDVGRMHSTGGRLAALWQATDRLSLAANFLTQRIEQDGRPVATVGRYEQARIPVAPLDRVRGEAAEIADTDTDLVNLVLNYDLGWAALTSAASWVDGGSEWTFAYDTLTFVLPSSHATSEFSSFTAETRLASTLPGRLQFLGGLFYEDVDNTFSQEYHWPGTSATNPWGTDPISFADGARQLDQRAVFGEVSYDLTDKLAAVVGGRYFKYEKDERLLTEGGVVGVPIGAGVAIPRLGDDDGSTFKANLSYKPTQDALLYASFAQGFRLGPPDGPGAFPTLCDVNGDGVVDNSNVSVESTKHVDSDFLDNYEIGGKFTLLDRRMVVDASVYHIVWDGLPILIRPSANCSYTANAGSASSDGVEFQASLFVVQGLRLDFGAGYTKAELSTDVPAQGWRKGARLPGSPKVNANLAAQYDFNVAAYKAFVRADSFYTDAFYGDLLETPGTKAGDYIKLDARAGVTIKDISLELFVRNLTNEDAYTWRGMSGTQSGAANPFFGYRLRPRTIGLQLSYTF